MYPFLVALVKATFLRYFLQRSQFISSGQDITPGTLVKCWIWSWKWLCALPTPGWGSIYKEAWVWVWWETTWGWLHSFHLTRTKYIVWPSPMARQRPAVYRHWKWSCWVLDLEQADSNMVTPKSISIQLRMEGYWWHFISRLGQWQQYGCCEGTGGRPTKRM